MSTWERIKKKVILGTLVLGMTLTLTGCDMPEDLQVNISNAFRDRANQNLEIASDLHNSGIISDNTFQLLSDSITKNLAEYGASIKDTKGAAGKNLLKACVAWRVVPKPVYDSNNEKIISYTLTNGGGEDWASQFLTNYMLYGRDKGQDPGQLSNAPILGGNSKQIKPIEVISESLVEQLNTELSIPVYVLKTNISDAYGIDGIMEAVKQAESNKSESGLLTYFEEAKYKDVNGNTKTLTLMDPTNSSEQLVRISSGAPRASTDLTVDNPLKGSDVPNTYKGLSLSADNSADNVPNGLGISYENEPGKDMIITMGNEPIMAIRVIEFNKEAVNTLKEKIGLNKNRYMVINNKAYLMEYPIGYIDGFKENEDRESYKSIIKESQIGFNLLTGDFSKFEINKDGVITNSSVVTNKEDPYLTFDGAKSSSDETKASLVLYGSTGVSVEGEEEDECNVPWNMAIGTYTTNDGEIKDRIVNTGRIVLRDYLEATYAPGVVGSDKLIVLGRKLRILKLEGSKADIVARFYDKDGNLLEGDGAKLYIDDFADIDKLNSSSPKVGYISRLKEKIDVSADDLVTDSDTSLPDEDDTLDEDANIEDLIKNSVSKIDKLDKLVLGKIKVSTTFPGTNIGVSDYSAVDEKPLFYAMTVKASMFQTGLFSGWVQSTDAEKNSTVWWNDWLGKHGFTYKINTDNLVNYLKGNYAYDLNKAGIVILDLETIAKIQQEYTQQHQVETAHGLRTLFIVVGYILIAYSTILLIAWNVDVNVDLGFNILEKISFGKWVAVKDYEEMPYMNTDETTFIKFGELVVKCIVIIALGMILIMVNIIDVILMLIQLFGGIAEYITRIITGVK